MKNISEQLENISEKIVIENPRGSYKSFEIQGYPEWKDYPLAGVTYPVDYGYIDGYQSEDGEDLDVFVGTGNLKGFIKIWRCDTPIETKIIKDVTESEYQEIIKTFSAVIKEQNLFDNSGDFRIFLDKYKKRI